MALAPGFRLGPYEILAPLGAGGMGEVYRARDTRLERTVAVKVLPARLELSSEARQRFEREARVISQLSHPHVCALFDVGQQDGTDFLVMELLEGLTLAERLKKGPLPLPELLQLGAEMADALDEAHRQGVVHRDLKPGNVMLTKSGAKLLDFGLAKEIAPSASGDSETPTLSEPSELTREGTALGTRHYMAPEQVEGRPADARSDIFALGVTLYEAACGRKPFEGRSRAALAAEILEKEPPPISALRPGLPPGLDRVVRTCLAKDPERRWRSAHDVGLQLAALAEETPAPTARGEAGRREAMRRYIPWTIAALAVGASVPLALRPRAPVGAYAGPVRFQVPPPAAGAFVNPAGSVSFALSPDGSKLAFVARGATGPARVWLRLLSELEARPLDGTEGASTVFWAPDGASLAFITPGKLKRLDLLEGRPATVCDLPPGVNWTGSWGANGQILYAPAGPAIYRVSTAGGKPEEVLRAGAPGPIAGAAYVEAVSWPRFLPDGERFLYLAYRIGGDNGGELMLAARGQKPRAIGSLISTFEYVEPGYILFVRDGTLLAQRFDAAGGTVRGEPLAIAEPVYYFRDTTEAAFSASRNGVVVFRPPGELERLVWFDRTGRELGDAGPPSSYRRIRLSADEASLVFHRFQQRTGSIDLWSLDLKRGIESRISSGSAAEMCPLPLPGGSGLVFSSKVRGWPHLFRRDTATGKVEELLPPTLLQIAEDVSPDGQSLAFSDPTETNSLDVFLLPLSGERKRIPLLGSPAAETDLRFSPDGRFVSFTSDESGQPEIYVAPFPGATPRTRVSSGGGRLARWARSGRELLYLAADGSLVAVPMRTSPALDVGEPARLFAPGGPEGWSTFEVAADAQRLLAVVPTIVANRQPLTVLVNWPLGQRR